MVLTHFESESCVLQIRTFRVSLSSCRSIVEVLQSRRVLQVSRSYLREYSGIHDQSHVIRQSSVRH